VKSKKTYVHWQEPVGEDELGTFGWEIKMEKSEAIRWYRQKRIQSKFTSERSRNILRNMTDDEIFEDLVICYWGYVTEEEDNSNDG